MTTQDVAPATNGAARPSTDDAARVLGISRPTVRRRLRSGALKGSRVATPPGRKWLVEVPTPLDSPPDESVGTQGSPAEHPAGSQPAVREVELLQAHVDDLRRQLEDRTREVRELHTLLAQAQQRLLTDAQVSTHGESAGASATPQPQHGAPPRQEGRPWWRRWFVWEPRGAEAPGLSSAGPQR